MFTARLAQTNLASKSDIANFVKKTDLKENKLIELSKKVKVILTKGSTKNLINNFSTLMEQNIFFARIPQNYLVFTS